MHGKQSATKSRGVSRRPILKSRRSVSPSSARVYPRPAHHLKKSPRKIVGSDQTLKNEIASTQFSSLPFSQCFFFSPRENAVSSSSFSRRRRPFFASLSLSLSLSLSTVQQKLLTHNSASFFLEKFLGALCVCLFFCLFLSLFL